jgi:hypothetical protein
MCCNTTSYGIGSANGAMPVLHKTARFAMRDSGLKNEVGERLFRGGGKEHAGANSELKTFVFGTMTHRPNTRRTTRQSSRNPPRHPFRTAIYCHCSA